MPFERKGLGIMEEIRAPATVSVAPVGGQGHLALAFQEILTVAVRLRSGRQVPTDLDVFRAQSQELLVQADQEARGLGYPVEFVKLAVYVTVVFVDEVVLRARSPLADAWAGRTWQEVIFGDQLGGERFFQHLEDLLDRQDSPFVGDILEVLLLCLQLGFQGRYAGSDGGDLRNLIRAASDKIKRIRGSAGPLSPHGLPWDGEVLEVSTDPLLRRLGLAAVGMVVGIVLIIVILRLFWLPSRIQTIETLVGSITS